MPNLGLSSIETFGQRQPDHVVRESTHRRALARGRVYMQPQTTAKVASNAITKGDVMAAARIAAIQAAKKTSDLVPMCQELNVGSTSVNFNIGDDYVEVEVQVETFDRTGVEMEALTAVSVGCLTIYDMCKTYDKGMKISEIALWEKSGGRSGSWKRPTII